MTPERPTSVQGGLSPAGESLDQSARSKPAHADAAGGPFPVVGIGASAGGLEAFTALVASLTDDTGMAFVAVSHLDPTHPSALSDILARSTTMPVIDIVDGQAMAPNAIYVLPPGQDVTIEGPRLVLHPRTIGMLHHPIDRFFRSLAEARGHQAIGVVLSGTATDGTLGVRAIKGAGGITFAQDDSAQQTSMPHSAIADGFVDFVLAPHEIGAELVRIGHAPPTLPRAAVPRADEAADVEDILQIVRRDTGVDFTRYKAGTLRRRILRRMILTRADRLPAYAAILRTTPSESRALHDDLLIGVTSFFRDPDAFQALARTAFRRLLEAEREADPIRLWVLGCSTGEEAYSLAIALTEYAEAAGRSVPLQVFASDVSAAGIEVARAATYPLDIAQDVSAARLARFFVQVDDHYRVIKSIREVCIFSRHNVLTDPPFSRIDLVSCRNLLMYFQPILQQDVIGNLHYALTPDGVLWLGPADTVNAQPDLFDPLDASHKIFGRRPGSVSHPVMRRLSSRLPRGERAVARAQPHLGMVDVLKESDRVLLHRFAPAGLVVSASMEVLQYRGQVGRYVSPAAGKASLNLLQILDRRLHVAVSAAITKARRDRVVVRYEHVALASADGGADGVTLEVVPIGLAPDGFLLLFEEASTPPIEGASEGPLTDAAPAVPLPLARVTKELADTQAYLRAVVEEQEVAREDLEAAHEEAQSANEELQSINEELETSKEEIQSANEELTTLNDELQHRNADLQLTNNDLVNLLASTDLAVVFVGATLEIRRFTTVAARLQNIRPADVGRPLSELRMNLTADVNQQVAHTLQTLATAEQRVQNGDGRWFSLRTRPYRTLDNQIDGVVLVLVDIDEIVRARLYAESIVATGRAPLVVLDERLAVVTANEAFYRVFDTMAPSVEGRPFFELGGGRWDSPDLRGLLQRVLPQNNVVKDFQVRVEAHGRASVWLLDAQRLQRTHGEPPLILLSMEDVSERMHAEGLRQERVQELAAADRSKNEFLAMLAHELRNPLAPIRTAAQMLGTPGVPPAVAANARVIIERQIRNMVRLIDDLLDVARITQNKLTLQLAPVDLTSVLRRAVEVVDRHIQDRGQQLSLSLPVDAIYVLGDTTRLEQVFGNLLNNASKFSNKGAPIHVRAHVESRERAEVVVHITDAGIGIDLAMLPHMFELFKQGAASPHQASGLGVGLALVRRIVELHGGLVTVSSAGINRGSEFVVRLPALADADSEAEPSVEPHVTTVDAHRILVVDDNADAAESLTALLRVYGHDARMVPDGATALEMVPSFRPTVVFLDIGMPDMDGYEVARRLRRLPGSEHALLIAVTGFGRDEDRQRSKDAGFDRHVTKPLDPRMLPSLIGPIDAGD